MTRPARVADERKMKSDRRQADQGRAARKGNSSPKSSEGPGHSEVRSRADSEYVSFWDATCDEIPSLKGARSTAYYGECERTVLRASIPDFRDKLILKTDLWNEAKSTDILAWAGGRGARVVGVDISWRTALEAKRSSDVSKAGLVVSDIRRLAFSPGVFDVVYSMGTIEHFPEYRTALSELYEVLRPGGIAIVGVPNKLDPFLRPALVFVLNCLGRYPYGREKSFTPQALCRTIQACGFRVCGRTGVLFIPGWLRLLDLWCHTHPSAIGKVVSSLVLPFAWLYRTFPGIRKLSYLTVVIAKK
jgi:SAM-dependent methyltransferase